MWEDHAYETGDDLLFGTRKSSFNVSTLHPDPVQIFRLWQVYLDYVNPLLKVTHTPTMQALLIEAAADVFNIKPTFEALMFSMYCVSISALTEAECQTIFSSTKADLSTKYLFGCHQALLRCSFLHCDQRESLTALFLYLVSIFCAAARTG